MNEDELAAFLEQLVADDAPEGDAPAPGERAPGADSAALAAAGAPGPTGVPGTGTPEGATGAEGVRRLLGDPATWAEPPAAGADALMAAIRAELPQQARPPAGAWGAPGTSGRQSRVPPRWSRPAQGTGHVAPTPARRWGARQGALLAVAAVALVVVGVVGGLAVGGDSGDDAPASGGEEVALAGTDLQPQASGLARVEETGSGVEVWLDVSGLPPAAPGTYYQAWVKGDDGCRHHRHLPPARGRRPGDPVVGRRARQVPDAHRHPPAGGGGGRVVRPGRAHRRHRLGGRRRRRGRAPTASSDRPQSPKRSRSSNFTTLPDGLRGRASTTSSCSGSLRVMRPASSR